MDNKKQVIVENNSIKDKIKSLVTEYNVIESLILIFSIITVNFTAYIAYYDVNAFILIDGTTILKHIIGLVIPISLVSASVILIFLFINNYILLPFYDPNMFGSKHSKSLEIIFSSKIIRIIVTLFIFSFFYVGIGNTLYLILFFFIYFIMMFVYSNFRIYLASLRELDSEKEKLNFLTLLKEFKKERSIIYIIDQFMEILKNSFRSILKMVNISVTLILKRKYIKFITSNIGIMLIFVSLFLGISRANFVENNIHVKINDKKKVFVLFLNTSNGIALFDKKEKSVSFISWDRITKLDLLKEKRRYWGDLKIFK